MIVPLWVSEEDLTSSLIRSALEALREARESKIRWANGDEDLIRSDRDDIDAIDDLLERL